MARPTSSTLSLAQRRVLDAVLKRERLQLPNFVSDLVSELALKAESSLGPTLQRMARLGVVLIQGGGVKGRQRLVIATPKGRRLCGFPAEGASEGPAFPSGEAVLFPGAGPDASMRASMGAGIFTPKLPLLGTIPAGPLTEVVTQPEAAFETVSVEDLLRHRPGDFLLRIKGDSMVGDGIFEGDLVLLRPGIEVQQGEIAAVIWSGFGAECEATLKRVYRRPSAQIATEVFSRSSEIAAEEKAREHAQENLHAGAQEDQVLFRASNPVYPDLLLPAHSLRIAGVFRGLIRQGAKSTTHSTNPTTSTSSSTSKGAQ
jgi:repressor LexA